MPECAEVAIFTNQLSKEYGGHKLLSIKVVGGRFKEQLSIPPLNNIKFNCKGKFLYWTFDEDVVFFITLGMTGSFGKKNKHSAIEFNFDNGTIYFNDIRRFGTFKICNKKDLSKKLSSLGWDPLKESLPNLFPKIRKNDYKMIGEFLMEQKVISGIGNYLRAEILYKSNISPFRSIFSLSDNELLNICNNYIEIVNEAYKAGGATLATYSDLYGIAGNFYKQFKVYGQEKDPFGNSVLKSKDKNGRTIHWVKEIQV